MRRPTVHVRWPFWLLLAAWFCANCPSGTVYRVASWIDEARSFSHQGTLTRDVAFLLGGETTPERFAVPDDVTSKQPPRPEADVELGKKIEIELERTIEARRPETRDSAWSPATILVRQNDQPAPPHGPPRVGELS